MAAGKIRAQFTAIFPFMICYRRIFLTVGITK